MALLRAADKRAFNYVEELYEPSHLPEIVLNKLKTEYRRYLVCGGMPESVEQVLQDILDLYKLDFAKYTTPRDILRIHAICYSLPAQLAQRKSKVHLQGREARCTVKGL